MFTLVLVALLSVSFLCSLVLVAAMIVASRASARTVDALEQMQRIARTQPDATGDDLVINAESLPQFQSAMLAAHRNIAEELRTPSKEVHDQQSPPPADSLLASSVNAEQTEQIKDQT
ncbi:MAG: hypothetical protein R2911_04635 [Caldilineaceae bacterium]